MGKIFYGKRGSGKTVKLLKQAQALTYDRKIPVIVCYKSHQESLIEEARRLNIDTKDFIFITFTEFKESHGKYNDEVYRIMVDDLSTFIGELLNIKNMNHFYATVSSENCIEVDRSEWDKTYNQ